MQNYSWPLRRWKPPFSLTYFYKDYINQSLFNQTFFKHWHVIRVPNRETLDPGQHLSFDNSLSSTGQKHLLWLIFELQAYQWDNSGKVEISDSYAICKWQIVQNYDEILHFDVGPLDAAFKDHLSSPNPSLETTCINNL